MPDVTPFDPEASARQFYTATDFDDQDIFTARREFDAALAEVARLKAAVAEHAQQKADDRCWMDDLKLYEAFGIPAPDNRVGDKGAMLANCMRYIDRRCEGGKWPSYAELEAKLAFLKEKGITVSTFKEADREPHLAYVVAPGSELDDTPTLQKLTEAEVRGDRLAAERDKLQAFKDWVHAYLDSHDVPHHPPGTHGAAGCRIGDRMDWLMAERDALVSRVAQYHNALERIRYWAGSSTPLEVATAALEGTPKEE